jgi:hypothetical protein
MDVLNLLIVMCVAFSVSCVWFVCKCVLLPPGVNPIAVKYISYYCLGYLPVAKCGLGDVIFII